MLFSGSFIIFAPYPEFLKKQSFFFLCCCLFFYACNNVQVEPGREKTYFDIPAYFETEAIALQEQKAELEKSAQKDGKPETQTITGPDWAREFEPFKSIDLNKPALAGEFKTDTVFSENNAFEITYSARNPEIDLQSVSLRFKNDTLTELKVFRIMDNQVFSVRQNLEYNSQAYIIKGNINISGIYETEYQVRGKIVR